MKRIDIITLYPEYFDVLKISLLGKAISSGILKTNVVNLRHFAPPPHYNVDDTPYGGGAGMVMKADILANAIDSVLQKYSKIIFTSPAGLTFNQQFAHQISGKAFHHIIFVCGRFEGYDARIVTYYQQFHGQENIFEISIGNYVLNGGEVAVLVIIEALARLLPGFMGNPKSLVEESHELLNDNQPLLEYPNYTRPQNFRGHEVPEILLSGNHKAIRQWREEQSRNTQQHPHIIYNR